MTPRYIYAMDRPKFTVSSQKENPFVYKGLICPLISEDMCNSQDHRKECVTENYFSYFSTKTYVVGTQKNRLDETILLSTQNTCFN